MSDDEIAAIAAEPEESKTQRRILVSQIAVLEKAVRICRRHARQGVQSSESRCCIHDQNRGMTNVKQVVNLPSCCRAPILIVRNGLHNPRHLTGYEKLRPLLQILADIDQTSKLNPQSLTPDSNPRKKAARRKGATCRQLPRIPWKRMPLRIIVGQWTARPVAAFNQISSLAMRGILLSLGFRRERAIRSCEQLRDPIFRQAFRESGVYVFDVSSSNVHLSLRH